ncbi:hypothetical protein ECG_07522 [Echinococcus granulosus]|uniref:Ovule protein n=1 Tax=Echinococcus granulosus TaxID=6210 RepID=A0A068X162_ECHGR|nr:hypothetical protein ECG_07522 [Echinococcus granulosus]CDS24506.1 hypothetical protein EgrG_000390900 [Echinococcus granulosus]
MSDKTARKVMQVNQTTPGLAGQSKSRLITPSFISFLSHVPFKKNQCLRSGGSEKLSDRLTGGRACIRPDSPHIKWVATY